MVPLTVDGPLSPAAVQSANTAEWRRALLWGFVCWVVVFWRLGYSSLLDPDEAHYAQLTREMAHAGSWLVPLLDGAPFIDKPVLFHWMQGLAVRLLGETEFAIRLPSALTAVALFWTTRWLGAEFFGATAGEWAALMFATIPITFALASVGLFDMVFGCFLFGAFACLLLAAFRGRPRLRYAGYTLLTLAVMTKGPVALLLVGLTFALASISDKRSRAALAAIKWRRGLVGVLIASSPWFIWMWWHFGAQFVRGYLLAGNLWYFTQPPSFSGRPISHTFYIRVFITAFFPWSVVVIGGAIDALRRWRTGGAALSEEKVLWTWVVVVIAFFSVARFKLDHYIFPAAPACCVLAARAWMSASNPIERHRHAATRWAVLFLGISLVVVGIITGVFLFHLNLGLSPVAALIPVALTAGSITLIVSTLRRRLAPPTSPAVPIVMLLILYGTVVLVGFPVLERTRPMAHVARALRAELNAGDQVGLYRLERWRASLRYYLMRPVERLEQPDAVDRFLTRNPHAYIVMLQDDYENLRHAGARLRIVTARPAVVGTSGWALRRQRWSNLVVASAEDGTEGAARLSLEERAR